MDRPDQIVSFRVEATAGSQGHPIQMLISAPSGRVLDSQLLVVRTASVSRIALAITVLAALGLVVLWVRRLLRRHKGAAVSEAPLSPADAKDTYARNAAVMTVGTSLSRFTGFLRIATQTAVLGVTANALADTYNTANTTPNILYELALGGILTSVFVPLFVEWMQRNGRDDSWRVADRVLTLAPWGCRPSRCWARSSRRGSSVSTTAR